MSGDSDGPNPSGADERRLRLYATDLASRIDAALAPWVVRTVEQAMADGGLAIDEVMRDEAEEAGRRAQADVAPRVRDLLDQDIDDQRASPLALLRSAVVYPTGVLRDAGLTPPVRDENDRRLFPDDIYALGPATFSDVDPSLHEPGLAWGAAKAYVHLSRRRADGLR